MRRFGAWLLLASAIVSFVLHAIARDAPPASGPAVSATSSRPALSTADFDRHVIRLRKRLPADSTFHIIVERPFVVIGDEAPHVVQRHAIHTVRFAVERLKRDFFRHDPDQIIDIWLFKDDASYRSHTRQLFNDTPTTPFGYYSPADRALIMNIATGGGTLVHEIVHPYMYANFPQCPTWYNEGLGSLFEQSEDNDGHLRGLTNWRLAGLQKAIRSGTLPSFESLLAMDHDAFYNDHSGVFYAQSRYLCYYLQEHDRLVRFHRAFTAAAATDPTGVNTLRAVLNEPDLKAFSSRWEKYVLALTFP